jgi:hypothetical protein
MKTKLKNYVIARNEAISTLANQILDLSRGDFFVVPLRNDAVG